MTGTKNIIYLFYHAIDTLSICFENIQQDELLIYIQYIQRRSSIFNMLSKHVISIKHVVCTTYFQTCIPYTTTNGKLRNAGCHLICLQQFCTTQGNLICFANQQKSQNNFYNLHKCLNQPFSKYQEWCNFNSHQLVHSYYGVTV